MKKTKKILSLVLTLIMLFSVVAMTDLSIEASAASNLKICGVDIGMATNTFMQFTTSDGTKSNSGYYYNGKYLGASQCFGFARWCQYKLFKSISLSNVDEKYTKNSSKDFYKVSVDGFSSVSAGNLTVSKLKALINAVEPGAHLRTNDNSNGVAHSMIITDITSKGFSIAQCNGSNNNEYSGYKQNYIGTYTYTWSSYVSSTYGSRGIAYIEMPYEYPYLNVNEHAFEGKFEVKASSKPVRSEPSSSGTKVKTLSKGDTVTVKAYVYNDAGNLWYKTSSGDYIYSDNLLVVENDSLPPSNYIEAKFKVMCSSKPIRKEPISSSEKLDTVNKDDTVSVIGYVYNEYGALWYVCADEGFISHDYLSVVSSSSRTPSNYLNETLNVKAGKVLRSKPYGSSDKVSEIEKGDTLKVIGYVYNKWGNLWYYSSDKNYTYHSYLEQSSTSSNAPSNYVKRDFKLAEDKNARNEPYSVAEKNRSVTKGTTISTVGQVTNLYGNTWYLTTDDDYLSASNLTCVHVYNSKVTKNATCTAAGVKTFTCKYCGNQYTETIAKTSHTIVTDKAVEATCTKTGLTEGKHCSVCNTVTVAQQTVAKKSHNSNTTIPAVAATCTKTGLTEGKKCSVCGTVTVAQQTVAKKAHTYTSTVTTAATCTKEGVRTYKCSCGASYTEKIAKTSHNSNTTIPAVAATCTKTGLTEGKKCSVCGTVTVAQQTVAKKAHTYTSTVTTAATCTKEGVRTYKCSCGASYTEKIAKTSHNSNTTIPAVTATCTKTGLTEGKKCSVCGTVTVAQQTVAKKAHTEVIDKAVAATCTKTGLTEGKHCSVCGTVTVAQTTVNATGHKDNNFDGKCDSCGVSSSAPDTPSDSTDNCSCNCHKGGLAGFFFKIINFFQKLFGMNKVCTCGVKH